MANAIRFKQNSVPRQKGEQGRLKVVSGPDYGAVYVMMTAAVSIGRGEDVDVMISDLKASRLHAEIKYGPNGWQVQDMGSANGILHNGINARFGPLKTHDTITIGETTLEFMGSEAPTVFLTSPPKSQVQAIAEQNAFSSHQEKVRALGNMGGGKQAIPQITGIGQPQGQQKGSKVLLIVAVGAGLALFLGGEEVAKKPKGKAVAKSTETLESRDLASYLPQEEATIMNKSAEMFFRSGFREYRERNYLRAKTEFETVLQMSPGHPLARLYLSNCNREIEEEVKFHLDRGKKDQSAGKIKSAKGHYEAILRLLHRNQADPGFIEARDQLKKLDPETGEVSS